MTDHPRATPRMVLDSGLFGFTVALLELGFWIFALETK